MLLALFFCENVLILAFHMQIPVDHSSPRMGIDPQFTVSSNWTINVSDVRIQTSLKLLIGANDNGAIYISDSQFVQHNLH